jgi:hypothetical protein
LRSFSGQNPFALQTSLEQALGFGETQADGGLGHLELFADGPGGQGPDVPQVHQFT